MAMPTLPAAAQFVRDVRALYAAESNESVRWSRIRDAMEPLLADPGLKASIKTWPSTVEGKPTVGNLLFYEDPDYGFVLNATVRKPNIVTSVHDHGDVWTLYGLIEGHETMHRYERIDGGARETGPATLKLVGTYPLGLGSIDVVPPGMIHQEHAGPAPSVALIVRAKRPGTFPQYYYDPSTGNVTPTSGPRQIPFDLT
jgi:predicted metal-dependent enzyme (double-stranded beta helix superfamily)